MRKEPVYMEVADKKTGEISEVLIHGGINDEGLEVVSNVPMAPPVGWKPQPSLLDIVREQVKASRLAQRQQELDEMSETIDQADDFDIEDDPADPTTPYENDRDPSIRDLLAAGREALAARIEAAKAATYSDAPEGARPDGQRPSGKGDQGGSGGPPPDKKPASGREDAI